MTKLVMVDSKTGREDEIAEFEFSDDAKYLFDKYKSEGKYHVKIVFYGLWSKPQAEDEFIPV